MSTAPVPISPLKTLFDTASGYFLVTDTKSTVLYTNKSIEPRTGFDSAEIIGKRPGDLWGGKMPRSFYQKLWDVIQNRQQVFIGPVQNQRKNKELYEEQMYVVPLLKDQQPKYFVAFQPQVTNTLEKNTLQQDLETIIHSKNSNSVILLDKILSSLNHNSNHETILSENLSTFQILEEYLIAPTQLQYQNRSVDQDLIFSAQKNTQAFENIYHKYYKAIFLYFYKHISVRTLSEDLTQETFLRAFSHLSKFVASNATYQTYLLRIAHNILVNHYRVKIHLGLDEQEVMSLHSGDRREDYFYAKELLDKGMSNISPLQQDILNLHYNEGYSIREVADRIGKTENAVKLQLSRTRKILKRLIDM